MDRPAVRPNPAARWDVARRRHRLDVANLGSVGEVGFHLIAHLDMNIFRNSGLTMKLSSKWIAIMAGAVMTLTSCGGNADAADQKTDDKAVVSVAESSPLSVAPLDQVDYPLDRPSWIEEHRVPSQLSDGADLLISVSSGPASSPEIAAEMLDVMARGAVENVLEQMAQDGPEVIPSEQIQVDMDWVRDELISRRYDGTVGIGDEVRYESACLLRINSAEQRKLAESIQSYRLRGRLSIVGVVALMGFAGLIAGSTGLGWLASRQTQK